MIQAFRHWITGGGRSYESPHCLKKSNRFQHVVGSDGVNSDSLVVLLKVEETAENLERSKSIEFVRQSNRETVECREDSEESTQGL